MDEMLGPSYRTGIPDIVYLVSFMIMCFIIICGIIVKNDTAGIRKVVAFSLLAEYSFLVLCTTVICRHASKYFGYKLMPLWSYKALYNGDSNLFIFEPFLNIVLFVPIGLLLSCVLKDRSWWIVCGIGMGFSIIIEMIQPLLERGYCETDDIIHNTLGCLFGYGIYKVIRKIKFN